MSRLPDPTPQLPPPVTHKAKAMATAAAAGSRAPPHSSRARSSLSGAVPESRMSIEGPAPPPRSKSAPKARPDSSASLFAARRPAWDRSVSGPSSKSVADDAYPSSARGLRASSSSSAMQDSAQPGGVIIEVMPVSHRHGDSQAPWVPSGLLPPSDPLDQDLHRDVARKPKPASKIKTRDPPLPEGISSASNPPSSGVASSRAAVGRVSKATASKSAGGMLQLRKKWSVPGNVLDDSPWWLEQQQGQGDGATCESQPALAGRPSRRGTVEAPSAAAVGQRAPRPRLSGAARSNETTARNKTKVVPQRHALPPRAAVYAAADSAGLMPKRAFLWADRSRVALGQPPPPM